MTQDQLIVELLGALKEALLALDGNRAMNSREIIVSAIAKGERHDRD